MKHRPSYSDQEIIEMIREESSRAKGLEILYRDAMLHIQKLVRKYGGNRDDSVAISGEAMVVLIKAILSDRFRGDSSLKVFFIGICKTIWRNELNKRKLHQNRTTDWEVEPAVENLISTHLIQQEEHQRLKANLDRLGEKCQQVIHWRYYEDPPLNWKEVAQKMGYENAQVARNKGQKCLKQLREFFWPDKVKGGNYGG